MSTKSYLCTAMGTQWHQLIYHVKHGLPRRTEINAKLVETLGMNITRNIQDQWFRFSYECIIIWKQDYSNIKQFLRVLNTLHPKIKFKDKRQTIKYTIPGYINI